MSLPTLFSPLKLGSITLRNRIAMAPHAVTFTPGYGDLKQRVIDYHVERARGGAALITMSNFVRPPSWDRLAGWNGALETTPLGGLDTANDPSLIPHYRTLISAVHNEGAHFISQLNASGRQYHSGGTMQFGLPLAAPSALPCPRLLEPPKEMSAGEIEEYIEAFASAAECIAEAGGDGVELFAAQGYLLHQFLSPVTNRRTDEFGGGLVGRMRFLDRSIAAIRARTGPDFVIGVRINGRDDVPGGIDLEMATAIAMHLRDEGGIDYLNVSGLTSAHYPAWIMPETGGQAPFSKDAETLRAAVRELPVCLVSRITSPEHAEALLSEGKADFIGLVRPLISDPEWPAKANAGRQRDIRGCIYCNTCLIGLDTGRGVRCIHNTAVGREAQLGIGRRVPAPVSKKVTIVGGGPAGMAAARVAAERGHEVTLYEATNALGGQLRLVEQTPSRHEYEKIRWWLEARLAQLRVEVRLNTKLSAAQLASDDADVIILAIGSNPVKDGSSPSRQGKGPLSGTDLPHVVTDMTDRNIGRSVAIIDEDPCQRGTAAALYLGAKGHEVTLVTPHPHVGVPLHVHHVPALMRELNRFGIRIVTSAIAHAIDGHTLWLEDRYSGGLHALQKIDTILLSTGHKSLSLEGFLEKGRPIFWAGDCLAPRGIEAAIWEGERAGYMT